MKLIDESFVSIFTGKFNGIFHHHLIYDTTLNPKTYASYLQLKIYLLSQTDMEELPITIKSRRNLTFKQRIKLVESNEDFLQKILDTTGELKCTYCGIDITISKWFLNAKPFPNQATVDHVIPISKGGLLNDDSNKVPSCSKCNNEKGNKILTKSDI